MTHDTIVVRFKLAIDIRGLAPLLQVFDMPRAIGFYRDILGFKVLNTSTPGDNCDWALLRLNGVELMLNTAYEADQRPADPEQARVTAHADTALYFACPNVEETYLELRAKGLDLNKPSIAPYGMLQLYLTDPDGYQICFQWTSTVQTVS